MSSSSPPAPLPPSRLGAKQYWDDLYGASLAAVAGRPRRHDDDDDHDGSANDDTHHHSDDNHDDDDTASDTDSLGADPGTTWFAEFDAPAKVLALLISPGFALAPVNRYPPRTAARPGREQSSSPASSPEPGPIHVLDVGTGNGDMLARMRVRGGFARDHLVGVDYSPASIELARRLHGGVDEAAGGGYHQDQEEKDGLASVLGGREKEGGKGGAVPPAYTGTLTFAAWDVFSAAEPPETRPWFPAARGGFDLVLDKGTFDAISLAGDRVPAHLATVAVGGGKADDANDNSHDRANHDDGGDHNNNNNDGDDTSPRLCAAYPPLVHRLLRPGGLAVVTSCNWTEPELARWFCAAIVNPPTASAVSAVAVSGSGSGSGFSGSGSELGWGPSRAGFSVVGRVEDYRKFVFGGVVGQGVCTVVFRKE